MTEKKAWSLNMVMWMLALLLFFCARVSAGGEYGAQIIRKEERRVIVKTESGSITAVDVRDGGLRGAYHLQFISMEPSSIFLPVLLHADMVFYVHTGKGTVNYLTGEDHTKNLEVQRGDVFRIEEGSVFYLKSHADPMTQELSIHAIFSTISTQNHPESYVGAYSSISDLVRGFDEKVLQMAFGVSEEVAREIKSVDRVPPIVPYGSQNKTDQEPNWEERIFGELLGRREAFGAVNKKKKKKEKSKTFNIFREDPDVHNCNGWSISVTKEDLKALKGSDLSFFMVNLTKGSIMGPHWNPMATEIAIVLYGEGMLQVVCPSNPSHEEEKTCENSRIRVKEGDIFVVPRYHPMAQMSFNNNSLVFVGFSTMAAYNHPQFLTGSRSVLHAIDKEILEVAFNSPNTTIEDLLASQNDAVMLECTSCAEDAERKMEEEMAGREQEEEARKREEEKRKQEEEAAKRREEEEARKRQEEEEEEARKREEEKRQKEEEEARKRQEEEEEEARKREEEKRKQEEEEAKRREEEEEEEARKSEEEKRQQEEEEARRREEEEARKRQEEEEEAQRREEEEAHRKQEEEEAGGQEERERGEAQEKGEEEMRARGR